MGRLIGDIFTEALHIYTQEAGGPVRLRSYALAEPRRFQGQALDGMLEKHHQHVDLMRKTIGSGVETPTLPCFADLAAPTSPTSPPTRMSKKMLLVWFVLGGFVSFALAGLFRRKFTDLCLTFADRLNDTVMLQGLDWLAM